jgi:hypothetical protein
VGLPAMLCAALRRETAPPLCADALSPLPLQEKRPLQAKAKPKPKPSNPIACVAYQTVEGQNSQFDSIACMDSKKPHPASAALPLHSLCRDAACDYLSRHGGVVPPGLPGIPGKFG